MACLLNGACIKTPKIKFMINLVREKEDLDDKNTYFPPAIMPAIIEDFDGDTGTAEPEDGGTGTAEPEICLSFWSSSLKTIITTNMNGSPQIDKIIKDLNEDLPVNFYNQRSEFLALYDQELSFKPHGKLINVFEREDGYKKRIFNIYFNDFEDDDESFKQFHRRMESFALLFIDGARRITVDPRWCCFTLYEVRKYKRKYNFIGYSTVYRFQLIPDKIRSRISQFFIIPSCQRNGFGKKLLRAVQNYIIENFNILEITVEEPCDAFSEMREIVDAERILTWYPSFIPQILDAHPSSKKTLLNEFHKRLFIPKKRTVYMYELVKLYCILKSDPIKIEEFRNEIAERIKTQQMRSKFSKTYSQISSEYDLRSPKKYSKIPHEYKKLFQKRALRVAMKLIRTENSWFLYDQQNDTNFTRQRRQGLRALITEEFQGRPAISLEDIDQQFNGLFRKFEIVVEKLIASESDWNLEKPSKKEKV